MKLFLVLLVCAAAAAAPNGEKVDSYITYTQDSQVQDRNIIVNALIRQLFELLREVIHNGSHALGIPPLDPLNLDHFHLNVPAGIINLELELEKVFASGFGGFVVHASQINFNTLAFDIEISFPLLDISAGYYDFIGDLFGAIPLYGKGDARFVVDDFRVKATLILKQSDDGKSVLLERIDNASFGIRNLKSQITGAIGGGTIDAIINAMIEDVIIDYINRFHGAISSAVSSFIPPLVNPLLDQLDTWKYIALFVPN